MAGRALPSGAPAGVLVLGVALGSLQALTAVGLVLIYRAAKVINFAQVAMGGLAAAVAVVMVAGWDVGYPLAVLAGLVVAALTGVIVELTVVRRFWSSSRLVFTVATIGVGLILGSLQVALPGWISDLGPTDAFAAPLDVAIHMGPIVISGDHLVALVVVPIALCGLWLFLERTRVGAGVRAMADAPERARLLGVPLRRLSMVVWVLAATLSGLAALLNVPLVGANLGSVDAPQALLIPLAAAVVARMERIGVAAFAAVGIGVIDQLVFWSYPRSSTVDVVLFAIVLVALLLQRRGSGSRDESGSDHIAVAPAPVPSAARRLPEVRVARAVLWALVVVVAFLLPQALDNSQLVFSSNLAIYGILAVSLAVLTGWAGLISLGQFAFAGVGASACAYALTQLDLDVLIALPIGMVVGAVVAALVGLPAIRFKSLFFAVTTFALAVPVSTWLLNPTEHPALAPSSIDRPVVAGRWSLESPLAFYYLCLAALVLVIALQRNLRGSRPGRAIRATRDNARLAAVMSVSPGGSLLTAMMISGAMAGLAGGLWVIGLRGVPFNAFSVESSVELFTMVVIGGVGSILGVLVGATYVWSVEFFLRGPAQLFASGAGMLVLLMVLPQGLGGAVYEIRDRLIEWRLTRRGMVQRSADVVRDDRPSAQAAQHLQPAPDTAPVVGAGSLVVSGMDSGYGHLQVVRSVNLSVAPGEVVALSGPNGAGKTTLLRVISGLLDCWSGTLVVDGRSLEHAPVMERVEHGMATVFGGEEIFGSLTVSDNMEIANWLGRSDEAHQASVWALFPELTARASNRADGLSGGERQMLAIAQALLTRPRFLLIDELTLGLSPARVSTLKRVIRELADGGTGVLIVEQSAEVVADIADREVSMERGVLRGAPTATIGLNGRRRDPNVSSHRVDQLEEEPLLAIRDVSVNFGGVNALSAVSLELAREEIVGIIGSNGAGKTTLLDTCSGFVAVDDGSIELRGTDITRFPPAQRAAKSMGRMFQSAMVYPSMTVSEVLAVARERFVRVRDPLLCAVRLPNAAASEEAVRRYVSALIEQAGLGEHSGTRIADLPLGVRRKVQLWAALAHEPSVLLLDEPTAGLPADDAREMGEFVRALPGSNGLSVLMIEHDVPLIASVADRLVAMDRGVVLCEGAPTEVLAERVVLDAYFGAPC